MVRKAEDFSVRKDYRRRSYAGIVTDEMILSGEKDSPKITKLFLKITKEALGFSAVVSSAHSWVLKGVKDNPKTGRTRQKGAQIDLLIDRNDDSINLCEMKYSNAPYVITEEEDMKIRSRKVMFQFMCPD